MADPAKPLRADAVRNRELVLETAYATIAARGLSVPIDEIARRAGVGAGTVYRHFPTKNALFIAVFEHRLQQVVTAGRALLDSAGPGEALFGFIRAMAVDWGAVDQGLTQVIAGDGIDLDVLAPDVEAQFLALIGELLADAQRAGTARGDLTVRETKAIIVGCQAVQGHTPDVAERVITLILGCLRPEPGPADGRPRMG
ncbi:TetR/AcrR family transcriptional regulator [Nocardia jinanensis]|uniref:Transcriptional regulatory protein TetR n=1 Tax=Nocardia jinanensis TaxID=382504 RepID=A0A917RCP1_9NOCA|nr:TetR/AcrR family transcriptional regulator [Nocardia jinanensis]GGL00956.1 putative transcriptional regulatory protein TetR [Nocardia jinanensis]